MSKRIEGPIELEHGTFKPGDQCIAVTVCTGRVNVARVEYVGYVVHKQYDYRAKKYEDVKRAQIRRPIKRGEWYDTKTNEKCAWRPNDPTIKYRYVPATIVSTLIYNRLLPAQATVGQLMKEI